MYGLIPVGLLFIDMRASDITNKTLLISLILSVA